ncbi:MAG TPA: ABC transporter ATP-binding protein [Verrucomicrobiae bacterium]|nr:ABC transporter ATP-binding protein [Verrucomicrobiae bacterium]
MRDASGRLRASMITIEGVSMTYAASRRAPPTQAIASVSFEVPDGSVLALVVPSGCGKSTLLHLIAGLDRPTQGRIALDGTEVTGPGKERVIAFQQPVLYPWLDVFQNVAFGLKIAGRLDKAERKQRVQRALEITGLKGFDHYRPYELSGGMQQRVAIARALVVEPRILLLDEPFGALDALTRSQMQAFLLEVLLRVRTTAILVTHDIDEAILLSDNVIVMTARPGRIAQTVAIPFPRPRAWEILLTEEALHLRKAILEIMRPDLAHGIQESATMPDR